MTIEHTDKIDFLSVDKENDIIKLTISDHLNWDQENEHLLLLQEKINTYLKFIESGELIQKYPDAKGKGVQIYIAAKYKPSENFKDFLNKAKAAIEEAGFKLSFEHLT